MYSSGKDTGHTSTQSPQPVHLDSLIYRGVLCRVILKFPAVPVTFKISAHVIRFIFRCRPTSTSLGDIIHIAQSLVGNVLSSWLIAPPIAEDFSTRWTRYPESARSRAACIPEIPPPNTRTLPFTSSDMGWFPFYRDKQHGLRLEDRALGKTM